MRHLLLFAPAMLLCAAIDTRLPDAARNMDTAALRALIAQKADVNATQIDGTTALHWAAERDDVETVRLLLQAGANVKATNRYGMTPLALACTNGNGPLLDALLKAGADANAALPGGETALMTASRTGRVDGVKVLLAHGADVNAKEGKRGQTALMWAAAEGHTEVVELLLKAGADMSVRLDTGFNAFLFAVREGRTGVVRSMVKAGADVNDTIRTSQSSGRKLSQGGLPRTGTSALVLATANAHFELAGVLLDLGANPNAAGAGYTALHTVSWIRKPGGGDNDPSPQGSGNLSSLDIVRKLVKHGADINARMTKRVNVGLTSLNTLGGTPFFLAARTADAQLLRELASLGADTKLNNDDNSTPLMAAAGLGTRSPGEDAGTESEVVEALQALLELGTDINAVDSNGETAMHGAAYKNAPAAVQFLADKGAKIEIWNQKNRFGWTPLLIASGYRFGNFKPSATTVAVFKSIMEKAGVSTVVEPPVKRP